MNLDNGGIRTGSMFQQQSRKPYLYYGVKQSLNAKSDREYLNDETEKGRLIMIAYEDYKLLQKHGFLTVHYFSEEYT